MKKEKFIVLATGGTGGHIFPAQAIADKLKENNYKLHLICDQRTLPLLEGTFLKIAKSVIISPVPKSGVFSKLVTISCLLFSTLKFLWMFFKHRPRFVLSFGGYPTLPAVLSATILRIPLLLHEQNSVLGQINRVFLPYAHKLFTSFPNTKRIKDSYKNKVIITGLPVRRKIIQSTEGTNIESKLFKIMVVGGSQGAKLFSDVVPNAVLSLDKDLQRKIQITHQVRNNLIENTIKIYKKTHCTYRIKSFFKNIEELYQEHDLVITRAGASSVAELFLFQKACIIVPFAKAKDNHQYYNAKFLGDNSKSIVIEENNFSTIWLNNCLKNFLTNPKKVQDMEIAYNIEYTLVHLNASNTILAFLKDYI